jgi:hypothetical protein
MAFDKQNTKSTRPYSRHHAPRDGSPHAERELRKIGLSDEFNFMPLLFRPFYREARRLVP